MSPRNVCETVFRPPKARAGWRLEELLHNPRVLYFSYGRRALAEALRMAGVGKGDTVALPGFICRDVLSALNACGAVPHFYPVDVDLHLNIPPGLLPASKVIIAVNYFGFAQDLSPFREYCRRAGAVLVEDNAHGLFSRDERGKFLGTRGDIGIFCLRKSLAVPNGAALTVNGDERNFDRRPQEPFDGSGASISFRLKETTKTLVPILGARRFAKFISFGRTVRDLGAGTRLKVGDSGGEGTLPEPALPCGHLSEPICAGDPVEESTRRRALYGLVESRLGDAAINFTPVFRSLSRETVPYGYAFHAVPSEVTKIKKILSGHGLSCYPWPDLPEAIKSEAPPHYTSVWVVPFLW